MVDTSEASVDSNILALIRSHIEAHKTRITNEIRSYPMPIPACDAQYNFLLEERGRINREMKQLQALSNDPGDPSGPHGTLRAFIETSAYIHHEFRQELSAMLDKRRKFTGEPG